MDITEIWKRIAAIIPGESGTEVLVLDHPRYHDLRPIPEIVAGLAHFLGSDLAVCRQRSREILGRNSLLPLPLQRDFLLIPLRLQPFPTRARLAYGYVVRKHLLMYQEVSPRASRLYFGDGQSLTAYHSLRQIETFVAEATRVQQRYWRIYVVKPAPGQRLKENPGSRFLFPAGP